MRKNPDSHMQALKAEGKRIATANLPHTLKRVQSGHAGASVPTRNMIKALEMSPWLNTLEDWVRYWTAKDIVRLSKSRKKNPIKRGKVAEWMYGDRAYDPREEARKRPLRDDADDDSYSRRLAKHMQDGGFLGYRNNPGPKFKAAGRWGFFGDTDMDPADQGPVSYGRAKRVRPSKRRARDARASRADLDDVFGVERPLTRTRRAKGETRAERRAANRAAWAARHKKTSKVKPKKSWREMQMERVDSGFQGKQRRNPASSSLKNIPDYELVEQIRHYKAMGNSAKLAAIHKEMGRRVAAEYSKPASRHKNPSKRKTYWVLQGSFGGDKVNVPNAMIIVPPGHADNFAWDGDLRAKYAGKGYVSAYGPFTSKAKATERLQGLNELRRK